MKKRPSSAGVPGGRSRKSTAPPEESEEDIVNPAARTAKRCYIRERSRWESLRAGKEIKYLAPKRYDGSPALSIDGDYITEKQRKSTWLALARWLEDQNIDPETYINLQFDMLTTEDTYAP